MRLVLPILAVFYMILITPSCNPSKMITSSLPIRQGIVGYVMEVRGNQMPSPDRGPSIGHGIKTSVYVFEPTNISQVDRIGNSPEYTKINRKLIKTVDTDSDGYFTIELPAGKYSLFARVNNHYYANSFDGLNNINVVTVETNAVSQVNITISSQATY